MLLVRRSYWRQRQRMRFSDGRETIDKFLDITAKELDVKQQEFQLRERELEYKAKSEKVNLDHGKDVLKLQAEHLKGEQKLELDKNKNTFRSLMAAIGVLGLVVILAMLWNKDEIAMEIIKMLIVAFGSGGVGYALGKNNSPENEQEE